MNSLNLYGTVVKDFEVRYSQSANPIAIASSSVAVQDRFNKDKTHFFDVKCFGKTAEFAEKYFKKGHPILLSGRIEQETWSKDGKNFSKVVVVADTLEFTRGANKGDTVSATPATTQAEDEDLLPF